MVSDPRQIIDIQMNAHSVIFQRVVSCLLMDGLFIKEGYSSAQERLNVLPALRAALRLDWALLKTVFTIHWHFEWMCKNHFINKHNFQLVKVHSVIFPHLKVLNSLDHHCLKPSHPVDTFIQSDLHCIKSLHFYQFMLFCELNPQPRRC